MKTIKKVLFLALAMSLLAGAVSAPTAEAASYKPKKTSITSVSSTTAKKLTVKYKKVSKASGYQIQTAKNKTFTKSKKTTTVKSGKTVKKTVSGLTAGTKYYVRVRAYRTVKGKKYYASWSKVKSVTVKSSTVKKTSQSPETPSITPKIKKLLSDGEGTLLVRIGPHFIVDGYQIMIASDSAFTKDKITATVAETGSTITKEFTGLKPDGKYYVRIRAYNKSGSKKVYGSWSGTSSITVDGHEWVEDEKDVYWCLYCDCYIVDVDLNSSADIDMVADHILNVCGGRYTVESIGLGTYTCRVCGATTTEKQKSVYE